MPLPSSHLRVSSRTPLGGQRDRGRSRHSRDDRGRGGGGDWAEERSRVDRDRGYDRNRRHEREGRGQAWEMERERHRERRAREADREPGEITTSSSRMEDGELASQGRQPLATDSASSISPQKKRRISPIVWDLDDSKPGAAAAASLLTSRFGPSGSPRSQQRSSCSSSPLKQSPSEQGNSREKSGVSSLDGKQASVNGAPVATTRMSISPPSGRGTDPSHGTPVASRLSSLSYEDESGDVRMQDVRRVTGTPDSEDGLEPGQVLDSPMKQEEDSTPAPATIARSRWAEDPATPEHESLPSLCKARSRSNESEELHGKAASTSPEPGVFRNETCSHEDGDEEYERSEDSGSEDCELESEPEENYPGVPGGGPSQHRAIDMLQGCRSVNEFEKLNKINEGTYGVVFRARDKKTGELVALKQLKMENEKRGFPMTSLREINILLSIHHPSIVDVKEVVVGKTVDDIFMVMEYMEHDLKGLMDSMKQPFSQSEVKCLMLQLFDGVKYLHDNWVLHRDLKTSNLLLNNRGELKICDLGLARQYGDPLKEYTHEVVTLWYRAPELLLGARKYSTPIDMWSLGCIMAEFLAKEPLFPGKSPIDEIDKIFKTLGTPNVKIWPDFVKFSGGRYNFTQQPFNRLRKKFLATAFSSGPTLSNKGFDLLNRLLTYDPSKRITADEALDHEWFREVPLPKAKEFMPTFPARRVR